MYPARLGWGGKKLDGRVPPLGCREMLSIQ
jgi:hypothetical protein